VGKHLPQVRRSVSGQQILHCSLGIGFVIGLATHVGGYLLKASVTTEPFGLVADLLYALGWALSTVRPNVIAGPFTPRTVARFSAQGHQRGIALPAQGTSRVGTSMGIGNASTAAIPSYSATCWPTTT
jgi:hypothetical protein